MLQWNTKLFAVLVLVAVVAALLGFAGAFQFGW
jgi:hypothetical protein